MSTAIYSGFELATIPDIPESILCGPSETRMSIVPQTIIYGYNTKIENKIGTRRAGIQWGENQRLYHLRLIE
ncbi:unnamed protein product [Leptidea sinapis]|uniref:Uncharacterized protein n=1 Tax=Leptidea sinapis TaxID=189913 RepID=A0A5E4PXK6_9NEOP|nr:unnamed protein product [Leptidea sinapis]